MAATAPNPNSLWSKNLAKPDGLVGKLVSEYLAFENYELNMWAVHALEIQKGDKILEIGFGPGIATQEMVKTTPAKYIAGIDYSELMVARAKRRNLRAVERGRVDLRHANVTDLPDFGTTFDRIIVINNIMYWPEVIQSLRNVRQLLSPGGLISLVIQRNPDMYYQGKCKQEINWYIHCLRQAGFPNAGMIAQPVTLERKLAKPSTLVGISIYGFNPVIGQKTPEDYDMACCKATLTEILSRPATAGSMGIVNIKSA